MLSAGRFAPAVDGLDPVLLGPSRSALRLRSMFKGGEHP